MNLHTMYSEIDQQNTPPQLPRYSAHIHRASLTLYNKVLYIKSIPRQSVLDMGIADRHLYLLTQVRNL